MAEEKRRALSATLSSSVQALGRGFDVTSDTRLLYCKGAPTGSRLVLGLDEGQKRDLTIGITAAEGGPLVLPDVPSAVAISAERSFRETTHVCSFDEVVS